MLNFSYRTRPGAGDISMEFGHPRAGNPNRIEHPQRLGDSFGCPFRTVEPPRPRQFQTKRSSHGSATPRPDILSSDEELLLAYQAVKSRRRSSIIASDSHMSSKELLNQNAAAVESRPLGHASPPPSVTSASKCPIRFLDQTSPEVVAEYFNNHKHELPKSHETCIKRHQSNADNIRELDAKYVNLVSMIQGLGETHQPLLPDNCNENETLSKIQQWAAGLKQARGEADMIQGEGPEGEAESDPETQEDERGRPNTREEDAQLKEIRLGESPTRPWGVHVPAAANSPLHTPCAVSISDSQQRIILTPSPQKASSPYSEAVSHPNKFPCPEINCRTSETDHFTSFAELARHYVNEHDDTTHESRRRRHHQHAPAPEESAPPNIIQPKSPTMYFTGPVFIGYSAQEAMELSRQFPKGS